MKNIFTRTNQEERVCTSAIQFNRSTSCDPKKELSEALHLYRQ